MSFAIEVRAASKRYAALAALTEVDLRVRPGEIHGLIGPNGSGKSTLLKAIAGEHPLTSGSILLRGADITRTPPHLRARQGLAIKFQVTSVIPDLTLADNLLLALQAQEPMWRLIGSRSAARLESEVERLLADVHLSKLAAVPARALSHGQQQWLEIAMVLALRPSVLLLDEATAGMSPEERRATASLLMRIREREQVTLLLVEHDLDFVRELCDELTVLHNGRVLETGSPRVVSSSERVKAAFVTRVA